MLIGRKPLLTTGKSGRESGYEASIQKSQACYKVAFIVVDRANGASSATPCGYPLDRRLHLPSAGDPARVRRRGIVRLDYVVRIKAQARAGDYLAAKKMFALVVLELWFRIFSDGECA